MNRLLTCIILLTSAALLAQRAVAREYSALVVEPESGRVLYEQFANEPRHPASVTKMMTLYLVFEALERGDITLNTPLDVSRNAVLRPPSRLGLTPGETVSVEDAILALVTRSANDVATVIAENLGGSETAFAEMMTAKARSLGMRDTLFRNASGLPDPQQVTTAWDMYRLGRALLKEYPRYYPYFSTPRFYYRGQSFDNHNHLMETYPGMDGIKTGFINSSGFNLVASARRGGRRLIGVVFGGPSAKRRDSHMREILDDGFAQLDGAPPGFIVAGFPQPDTRAKSHFAGEASLDTPQVSFGNAKRFKSGRGSNEPQPTNKSGPAPRHSQRGTTTAGKTHVQGTKAGASTHASRKPAPHAGKSVPAKASPAERSPKKSSSAKVATPKAKTAAAPPACGTAKGKSAKCKAR